MNPFVELWEAPVATLAALAYALVLLAALLATWYGATRNALYLTDRYQDGWKYLPPFWWSLRAVAMLLVAALDLLLLAGIVHVLT